MRQQLFSECPVSAEWAKQDRIQQFPFIYLLEGFMDVRQPFSRRRFVGGVAAAVGALSLRPDGELLAQGQTAQFTGGDAEYDAYVKLASNENNWGPPDSVMKAMNSAWKYANRYGYPDGNINQVIAEHHGVKRDNILLTAGSGEGLNVMATTYLGRG